MTEVAVDFDTFDVQVAAETTDVQVTTEMPGAVVGVPGLPGPPGPPGLPGGELFVHRQTASAATWTVTHPLGSKPPVVIVLDDAPTVPVYTDTFYPDDSTVVLEFPTPVTGYAYL